MPIVKLIDDQRIENCIKLIRQSKGMTVSIRKPNRSTEQNDYMHWLLELVADYMGENAEAFKLMLKIDWLGYEEIKLPDGRVVEKLRETRKLNVPDCSKFIDKLTMLANSLGVKIPSKQFAGLEK